MQPLPTVDTASFIGNEGIELAVVRVSELILPSFCRFGMSQILQSEFPIQRFDQ